MHSRDPCGRAPGPTCGLQPTVWEALCHWINGPQNLPDCALCSIFDSWAKFSPSVLFSAIFTVYVQFLGCVEVDQPKGSEMVRDAIRKMKVIYIFCYLLVDLVTVDMYFFVLQGYQWLTAVCEHFVLYCILFIIRTWHGRTHTFTISIIRMNWEIEIDSLVIGFWGGV